MRIDNYSRVSVSESEALEALYANSITDLRDVCLDNIDLIKQYNSARLLNADNIPKLLTQEDLTDVSREFFDESNQCSWFMPENYCIDLVDLLYSKCTTEAQRARVDTELMLFIQHGMFDLLFYLKYLVDTMREHKIVWGVGRGSSVASYVLFLIGVHKIDSIKYELDIHEFLKQGE